MIRRSLLVLAVVAAPSLALAADCVQRDVPTAGWQVAPSTKTAETKALEEFLFTLQGADEDRIGTRTDGVVIVKDGKVVYEKYARGWDATKPHLSWSVSKSFTVALAGVAEKAGLLTMGDSICKWVKGLPDANCVITLQHLAEFSSGLDWLETYEGKSNQASSVLAMLYGQGHRDMATFIGSHPRRDEPGATYAYSSGDTTLLAAAVDAALRPSKGADYPWTELFDRIGMTTAVFEADPKGTYVGSSYVYATPLDLAKFGFLVLNDGCWSVDRILPEGWVAKASAVSEAFKKKPLFAEKDDVQGAPFWLNRPVSEQNVTTPWPDVPEEAFAARGHWGQSITVIPSEGIVVVRVADDRDGTFDFNGFLKRALAVAR